MGNFPSYKPPHMSKTVFDYLKKYAPHNLGDDTSVTNSKFMLRQEQRKLKDVKSRLSTPAGGSQRSFQLAALSGSLSVTHQQ